MIKIMAQATHLKIFYDDATQEEKDKSELLVASKFCAEERTYSPWKKGYTTEIKSFYIKDKQILPVGFLPYLEYYYNENKIQFQTVNLRKYPSINKTFIKSLINKEINCNGKTPRDYQIESVVAVIKSRGGIIKLPMGCLDGTTEIQIQVDDELYNILQTLNNKEDKLG